MDREEIDQNRAVLLTFMNSNADGAGIKAVAL